MILTVFSKPTVDADAKVTVVISKCEAKMKQKSAHRIGRKVTPAATIQNSTCETKSAFSKVISAPGRSATTPR
jgi:hypothetical protein